MDEDIEKEMMNDMGNMPDMLDVMQQTANEVHEDAPPPSTVIFRPHASDHMEKHLMNDMPDMMDMMQRTANELGSPDLEPHDTDHPPPTLHAQSTITVDNHATNLLIGHPLNAKSPDTKNKPFAKLSLPGTLPLEDNGISDGPVINIGFSTRANNNHDASNGTDAHNDHNVVTPDNFYLDDDMDEFYDPKDDLTKEQQKNDANVEFARKLAHEMDRMADEVMNIDPLEQQYRMIHRPDDPKNIFVLKFGKNEEQHWKLKWNPRMTLMCHMEPNKLLIEQSKYNGMYLKYGVSPALFKEQQIQSKKQRMKLLERKKMKEMRKKSKIAIEDAGGAEMDVRRAPTDMNLGNGGLAPPSLAAPRGTMLVNTSMLVHSQQTVANATPTEQQKLLMQPIQTEQLGVADGHQKLITPISSQIRPELLHLTKKAIKLKQDDAGKPAEKVKQRRVSLGSVQDIDEIPEGDDEEEDVSDTDESDDDDDDDDDAPKRGRKRASSKLKEIKVSVTVNDNDDDQKVELLDIQESKDEAELEDAADAPEEPAAGKQVAVSPTKDNVLFSPPRITYELWMAEEIWKGMLYLGDEYDALNILEIFDHRIRYFINCAAGDCGFEHQQKLEQFWLRLWKEERETRREKRRDAARIHRQKQKKARLKRFQRDHPHWVPRSKKRQSMHRQQSENADDELDDDEEDDDDDDDLAKFVDMVAPQKAKQSKRKLMDESDTEEPYEQRLMHKKQIEFKPPSGADALTDFEYFTENRAEWQIIQQLHAEILELEEDDSDHSDIYDSLLDSDQYGYSSDEYDEYFNVDDDEIIRRLCPFKFLNIYAHNWEGYQILDFHMNDVWHFIEECRKENLELKQKWRNGDYDEDDDLFSFHKYTDKRHHNQAPHVSCLVFCSKRNVSTQALVEQLEDAGHRVSGEEAGQSLCDMAKRAKQQQLDHEQVHWDQQAKIYEQYAEKIQENELRKKQHNKANSSNYDLDEPLIGAAGSEAIMKPIEIKHSIINAHRLNANKNDERFNYKYWDTDSQEFWDEFDEIELIEHPLNRLFATPLDRSATLVFGFMVHSGIRLKQAYKALIKNGKHNVLRNQSFLRQLIQLDWMKHTFEKPGIRAMIPFRDEYTF